MDRLEKAADQVARDFLKADSRKVPVWDVTVTRNAILDCFGSSPEPDFIAKICACRLVGWDARRVPKRRAQPKHQEAQSLPQRLPSHGSTPS